MLLYTDGVSEAVAEDGSFFSLERIIELLKKHGHLSCQEARAAVLGDLETFMGKAEQHDDITMVVVKRKADVPEGPADGSALPPPPVEVAASAPAAPVAPPPAPAPAPVPASVVQAEDRASGPTAGSEGSANSLRAAEGGRVPPLNIINEAQEMQSMNATLAPGTMLPGRQAPSPGAVDEAKEMQSMNATLAPGTLAPGKQAPKTEEQEMQSMDATLKPGTMAPKK
jgi:hypothetical protein